MSLRPPGRFASTTSSALRYPRRLVVANRNRMADLPNPAQAINNYVTLGTARSQQPGYLPAVTAMIRQNRGDGLGKGIHKALPAKRLAPRPGAAPGARCLA